MSTKQSTITVVTDNNKEYTIRVCGTVSDPYFFGKDVCEIMELEKAVFDNVSDDHKKELKILLEEHKEPTLLGEFNLKTLSYHDGRVVVLSESGLQSLLNGTNNHKNKKKILEAVNRFI
jgi:prophage antirepressor-like protein